MRDGVGRCVGKQFNVLANVNMEHGTRVVKTLSRQTMSRCWRACERTAACESALHFAPATADMHAADVRRARRGAGKCELLDSVAEHRLVAAEAEAGQTLLYSANRREMAVPLLGWNDTRALLPLPTVCQVAHRQTRSPLLALVLSQSAWSSSGFH